VKRNALFIFLALLCGKSALAIPDQEPEVTAEVAEVLAAVADGNAAPGRFTERGVSYLAVPGLPAALNGCPRPIVLELLSRNVFGEDRLYVYRAKCHPKSLRIAVDFNKAARINRLELAPER
jgi:hypothetical protein